MSISEQEHQRRQSLEDIIQLGLNPYPSETFIINSSSEEIKNNFDEKKSNFSEVKIAGRLMSRRIMGSASFAEIQDSKGRIQIYVRRDDLCPSEDKTLYNTLFKKKLDLGDIIGIEGYAFLTKMGEITIHVTDLKILSKSIRPLPVVKEVTDDKGDKTTYDAFSNKELRYRRRYVDLIVNPESKDIFIKRSKIINEIRSILNENNYLEVETPILQSVYGGTSAKPFESKLNALKMRVYMRISNEMYLKRLIGGGYERIFEFSQDFRNEGIDATHNPEFTLMETMCAYANYKDNMDLVEEMLEFVCKKVTGSTKIEYQGKSIDFKRPWKRIKMVDAIKKYAKIDVKKLSDSDLKKKLKELKIEIPVFKRGIAIEELFGNLVEHHLIQPTIVYDFPVETCGLAKPKPENDGFAERFEPYVNGWELGNVYSESNDPEVLEKYWKDQEKLLAKDDESQRLDKDFLNMLKVGMPPTSGVGIGFDRLVMILTNQPSIRDVIFFPFMKPEK